jgi:hypothetical protein
MPAASHAAMTASLAPLALSASHALPIAISQPITLVLATRIFIQMEPSASLVQLSAAHV